jgi:hypothetical protein
METINKASTQPIMDCAKADELMLWNSADRSPDNLRFRTRSCKRESIIDLPVGA